ncbi:peptide receptor GPCR [Elysia marginata]|uniref:Peptide receptor GPCR n=1 Tax=Elysia marginata TaxID=1093978 RepID=A0AAV4FUG0_9GAST|nr:peptide receptor GPCR [Elysia marginata]
MTILPLMALVVLNTLIILEIRRSSRFLRTFLSADRRVQTAVSNEELKITMMLVAVIMAFFVCNTPYMVYNIMIATMDYDTVDNSELVRQPGFRYFKLVCHTLLAVRSSCNFVLYCWFSEKFRATFQRVFSTLCSMPGSRPYHLAPHGPVNGAGVGGAGHFRGRSVGGFGFGSYKTCPGARRTDSRYANSLSHTSNTTINRSLTVNYGRETTC